MADEKKPDEVTGGAQITTAAVVPNTPPKTAGVEIDIVTTAPGTFGPLGIVPVGSRHTIAVEAFSARWMKPARQSDAAAIRKAAKTQE